MTVTKEKSKKAGAQRRKMSTYEIVMARIRTHCEELEARGITLEKLIALRDQKRELATTIQEGGRA